MMAHYAFLDENNLVVEVIVGREDAGTDWENYYAEFRGLACKRTSYNTKGGVHSNGGEAFRKNYAGVGYIYDAERDAFIPPKPYASWVLDESTCLWNSPVPMPEEQFCTWDESTKTWKVA